MQSIISALVKQPKTVVPCLEYIMFNECIRYLVCVWGSIITIYIAAML